MDELKKKLQALQERVGQTESAVIAFSGGVDSTFLLKIAHDLLHERVAAVTAISESLPTGELEEAQALAQRIGARHVTLRTYETDRKSVV
jgi:uncharacterized protein